MMGADAASNDAIRLERLEQLVDDIESIDADLAEFFGDEFAASRSLLDSVIDALHDAAMETTAPDEVLVRFAHGVQVQDA